MVTPNLISPGETVKWRPIRDRLKVIRPEHGMVTPQPVRRIITVTGATRSIGLAAVIKLGVRL